jgi:hypothetical protein
MIEFFAPINWPTVVVSVAISVFAAEFVRRLVRAVAAAVKPRGPQAG